MRHWNVRWIEDDGIPLQHSHVGAGCSIHIGAGVTRGGEKIERYLEAIDAGRDFHVDTKHIHVVTTPWEILTVRANDDPGKIIDGPGGSVIAGNPLWIFEGQRASGYRDLQMSVEEVAWRIGEIHMQENW